MPTTCMICWSRMKARRCWLVSEAALFRGEVAHQDCILDEAEPVRPLATSVSRPAGGVLVLDL
jgi:hypothetical protein